MSYEHLPIEKFGEALIQSGDLDPVYIGLSAVPVGQRERWLVAYWCFYHAGAACHLSELEGSRFWSAMMIAARNEKPTPTGERWPRSAERRHFRGRQAIEAVDALRERWELDPEGIPHYIAGGEDGWNSAGEPAALVIDRARELRGFGPWIAFKCADMLERCLNVPIVFDEAAVFMFRDPALACDMLWEQRVAPIARTKLNEIERRHRVVSKLAEAFSHLKAPPGRDRAINIQEVETVLCKWKSHLNGHYPLGKDTREVRHGLASWAARCNTAARMLKAMPQ